MAEILGLHEIELQPGVTGEEFERFFREEIAAEPFFPGWCLRLLRGERGVRAGKYLMLIEIESAQARDNFSPTPGHLTEEAQQFLQRWAPRLEKWATFSVRRFGQSTNYTDYIVTSAE